MTHNQQEISSSPSDIVPPRALPSARRRPMARCRIFRKANGLAISVWDVVTQPFAEDKLPAAEQLVVLMDESRTNLHRMVKEYVIQHNLPVPMIWNDRF
jgi:hypothetical protein